MAAKAASWSCMALFDDVQLDHLRVRKRHASKCLFDDYELDVGRLHKKPRRVTVLDGGFIDSDSDGEQDQAAEEAEEEREEEEGEEEEQCHHDDDEAQEDIVSISSGISWGSDQEPQAGEDPDELLDLEEEEEEAGPGPGRLSLGDRVRALPNDNVVYQACLALLEIMPLVEAHWTCGKRRKLGVEGLPACHSILLGAYAQVTGGITNKTYALQELLPVFHRLASTRPEPVEYTSIQVNAMQDTVVATHRDLRNTGCSWVIVLPTAHTGGLLGIEGRGGSDAEWHC